jgi:hypothetical protein
VTANRRAEVTVNDAAIGGTGPLPDTGVMRRDGIRDYWCERSVAFDATTLKKGANEIELKVQATNWVQGFLHDYLRLELNEAAAPPKPWRSVRRQATTQLRPSCLAWKSFSSAWRISSLGVSDSSPLVKETPTLIVTG